MQRMTFLGLAAAATLGLAPTNRPPISLDGPAPRPTAAPADDFRWTGRIAAGKTLEVRGINGPITATAASGDEAEVVATMRGRNDDPSEVKVEVVQHEGGVTICAVYPPDRRGRANTCAPHGAGRLNADRNDVEVRFTVRVPAGVLFEGSTVNGDVEARGLTASVDASTVNGSVSITTSGAAQARTVNGSIRASLGRADWSGTARFKTVNGAIILTLPASLSAEVEAKTVNGDLTTDFPLTVQGRFGPRRLNGTVGAGGRGLELETVNGSIELRRQ